MKNVTVLAFIINYVVSEEPSLVAQRVKHLPTVRETQV